MDLKENKILGWLEKISNSLFSTRAGGIYILLFAASIGIATFIENDFGTSAAQKVIFKSRWFELLLVLFGTCVLVNIFRFKMIPLKKWASVTFHSSIIIILIGAGVTRYFGYEGMMHIREGEDSSTFLSSETFINFLWEDGKQVYGWESPILISSLGSNRFEEEYLLGSELLKIRLKEVIANPKELISSDPSGQAVLKIVIGGAGGREEYILKYGSSLNLGRLKLSFTDESLPGFQWITLRNDTLLFTPDRPFTRMIMATQKQDTLFALETRQMSLRSLYSDGQSNFVVSEFDPSAIVELVSENRKIKNESMVSLKMEVESGSGTEEILLTGRKGEAGRAKILDINGNKFSISYGSKLYRLPFSIALRDFILDRYPGTENPSSYASEVTLIDDREFVKMDYRIFMNNILSYNGFRFFQSSYDPDEAGTYLSVNHDAWGTWISYIGYALLTIGLIMIFFLKNTRFKFLMDRLKQYQSTAILIFIFVSSLIQLNAQTTNYPKPSISPTHAVQLGKMIVQDHQGRFKPFNTMSNEVLRKISKKEKLGSLSSEQVMMSMLMHPDEWEAVPLIHAGKHPQVLKLLSASEGLIEYRKFFDESGQYKLKDPVRIAQNMNPKDQGTFEKAIIKLDEKVNISNMVFSGRLFRILPLSGDDNHTWISPAQASDINDPRELFAMEFFPKYLTALRQSEESKDDHLPTQLLEELGNYQRKISSAVLPSNNQIKAELWLNKSSVFATLGVVFALAGVLTLLIFIAGVFNEKWKSLQIRNAAFGIIALAFFFQTLGLAARWYVSGRAPWSNGYESMIYISWTTVLAGLLFSRKSLGGLTATCILAATVLLVAGMSWLDPEITPLVPVLKSYWLTIHVSLEAGSYGFLMLGAVIGMLNLLLISISKKSNFSRVEKNIKELSVVSEITVTGGLIMVSVGTYLGGVWANESWGRYWGWDAKETWALVTILVYAFILHMRFIPGLKSLFAYNFASLFGFATVIMTYYGVNYYLSGLHSYAAGDPVPIPPQVYITAMVLALLSIVSFIQYRRIYKQGIFLR